MAAPIVEEHTDHLDENDEEYQQVRYYLQACLVSKGDVGRVDVWKITNQQLSYRFDQRSKALLKIISLTNLTTEKVGAENSVRNVAHQGFLFREGGLEFTTGVLKSVPPANPASLKPETYTLIYSDVAVGRSVIVEEKAVLAHAMPDGYDSFYVPQKPLDRNNDGVFDYDEFQAAANFDDRNPIDYFHRYYIKDSSQVLPRYVIEFSFAHKTLPTTATTSPTTSVGGKLLQSPKAKANPDDQIGYFDPVLFKPVTFGEYRRSRGRQLQTIDEAYEQAKADHKKPDVLVRGRRDWIEQQLAELDERLRQVNLNMAEVKEEIEAATARSLGDLRVLSRQKFEALLGVEIELNRQKEQLAWMDEVMKVSKATTEAKLENKDVSSAEAQVSFLRSWKCHTVMRNAITRMKAQEMNVLKKVNPDMALNGGDDLKVWLDPGWQSRQQGGGVAGGAGVLGTQKGPLWDSLQKGASQGHFSVPARPKHDLLVPSLQAIIDMESDRIQQALEAAKKDAGIALPPSVLRSPVAGDRYAAPLSTILTAHNTSVVHAINADPKQKFTDVMTSYVGKLTDRARLLDLSVSPIASPAPQHVHDYAGDAPEEPIAALAPQKLVAGRAAKANTAATLPTNTFQPQEVALGSSTGLATISPEILEKVAARFPAQSLRKAALLKKQRIGSNKSAQVDFEAGIRSLATSALLQDSGQSDAAEIIYLSLPAAKKPPLLKCIYSTREDPRGLNFMVDKCVTVSISSCGGGFRHFCSSLIAINLQQICH